MNISMSLILVYDTLIKLLLVFWLPAHFAHLIAFIIANLDDIFLDWKIFFLGDLAGWGVLCGVTLIGSFFDMPLIWLYLYYIFHILILSTIFTDAALYQETISVSNLKMIFIETLIESILIPWAVGIGVGALFAWLVW